MVHSNSGPLTEFIRADLYTGNFFPLPKIYKGDSNPLLKTSKPRTETYLLKMIYFILSLLFLAGFTTLNILVYLDQSMFPTEVVGTLM
jgi:hypothetical protein